MKCMIIFAVWLCFNPELVLWYFKSILVEGVDKLIQHGEHHSCRHNPDGNVHGANMGPNRGRQDPGGPHAGPINFAIWEWAKPSAATILT